MEALTKAGRTDLIGFDKNCLIRPRQLAKEKYGNRKNNLKNKHKELTGKKTSNRKSNISKKYQSKTNTIRSIKGKRK